MTLEPIFDELAHLMRYRDRVDDTGFTELMGSILAELDAVGWERGPDLEHPATDRLSLSGPPELFDLALTQLSLPITGDGWIIDIGIPPRDWGMYFETMIEGERVGIEAGTWCWTMQVHGPAVHMRIGIPGDQLPNVDTAQLSDFADVLILGEIGERNQRTHVTQVQVERIDTPATWLPMSQFRRRFAEQFPQCEHAVWLKASR